MLQAAKIAGPAKGFNPGKKNTLNKKDLLEYYEHKVASKPRKNNLLNNYYERMYITSLTAFTTFSALGRYSSTNGAAYGNEVSAALILVTGASR